MPSLKDLRNRIASVKATQKITKAMQMVAAAKLRRAQDAAVAARPFSQRMDAVLANLAAAMENLPGVPQLLAGTGYSESHLLVVCTAERGLCGAFNSSIARLAREHVDRLLREGKKVQIRIGGDRATGLGSEIVEVDTTNVLFIAGGAFEGLSREIQARKKGGKVPPAPTSA